MTCTFEANGLDEFVTCVKDESAMVSFILKHMVFFPPGSPECQVPSKTDLENSTNGSLAVKEKPRNYLVGVCIYIQTDDRETVISDGMCFFLSNHTDLSQSDISRLVKASCQKDYSNRADVVQVQYQILKAKNDCGKDLTKDVVQDNIYLLYAFYTSAGKDEHSTFSQY